MNEWPSSKAPKVFRALQSIGWRVKRRRSTSHTILERDG